MSDTDGSGSRRRVSGKIIAAVAVVLVIAAGAITAVVLTTGDDGNGTSRAASADSTLDALVAALSKHDAAQLRKIVCAGATGNAGLLKSKADLVAKTVDEASKTRAAVEHGAAASGAISVTTRAPDGSGEETESSVITLSKKRSGWCLADIEGTDRTGTSGGASSGNSASGSEVPLTEFVSGVNTHSPGSVAKSICTGSRLAGDIGKAISGIKSATIVTSPTAVSGGVTGTIHVTGYTGQSEDESVSLKQQVGGWCIEDIRSS